MASIWSSNPRILRSNSLPSLGTAGSLHAIFPEFQISSDEEDDQSEDYTEETDGSSLMSPYSNPPTSPFESSDVIQPDGGSGDATHTCDTIAKVKKKPRPLLLQPAEDGSFMFINLSISSPSIHKPPAGAAPVSTMAGHRAVSCLNFDELSKKNEIKSICKVTPWMHQKPNLHRINSVKKLKKLLDSHLADPNAKDSNGDAPIHVYINRGRGYRKELLVTLLCGGADVNLPDANESTPLHLAAMRDDMVSVQILIVFGANLKALDSHRRTPLDQVANKSGSVASLLETLLADPGFIHRSRAPTVAELGPYCKPDMIGYRLACRREKQLTLEVEERIKNMLHQQHVEDPDEAGAAFLQWNDILRWRQTKGGHVRPGSRVLFLDGGGIRGLVQIEILVQLEERTGQKITELFDWIVGTSTGGIVALGLVYAGLSLAQLRALFLRLSEQVFNEGLFGKWMQGVPNSLAIQGILQDVFKGRLMLDVKEPKVLISAVRIGDSSLPVEFFNNLDDYNSDLSNILVWKVARMTSAAPVYFTDYQGYIDGGIKANNPCELAMHEIRSYYETIGMPLPHFPIMVSVGTGIFPSQKFDDLSVSINGITGLGAVKDLFQLFLHVINTSEEQSKHFSNWCRSMKPKILFYRFNPDFSAEIKPNETNLDLLIEMMVKTKIYMTSKSALNDMFFVTEIFRELEDFEGL